MSTHTRCWFRENARCGLQDNEYELIDTGVFDSDRYWDVFVEYFKAAPDDILTEISVYNRGPEAGIHVLAQLWFRNTWSWAETGEKPSLVAQADGSILAQHASLGVYQLYVEPKHELLFCENETNVQRLYGVKAGGYFKDAFHEYVVGGNRGYQSGRALCAASGPRGNDAGSPAALRQAPVPPICRL